MKANPQLKAFPVCPQIDTVAVKFCTEEFYKFMTSSVKDRLWPPLFILKDTFQMSLTFLTLHTLQF